MINMLEMVHTYKMISFIESTQYYGVGFNGTSSFGKTYIKSIYIFCVLEINRNANM